jgi:hypothetical protein
MNEGGGALVSVLSLFCTNLCERLKVTSQK